MPEFTTVSMNEAQLRTIPGRQGKFINEYADYIQQLPTGQAGKLTIGEGEAHCYQTPPCHRCQSHAYSFYRQALRK
jgi:hypothetical protein